MTIKDFKYLLNTILLLLGITLFIEKDIMGSVAVFLILLASPTIGNLLRGFHSELKTTDTSQGEGKDMREVAALLESSLFSILLATGQTLLVTGYIVIKSIGSQWGATNRKDPAYSPAEEGKAIAVFRTGVVLQIALAIIAAYFLTKSMIFSTSIKPFLSFLDIQPS